jgi:hypothetical protein
MHTADLHLPLNRLPDRVRNATLQPPNPRPEEEEYQKQRGAQTNRASSRTKKLHRTTMKVRRQRVWSKK